ncbi:MAG: hypothetical protein ACK41C_15875 [Phenylobacterium sp.]|jgi:hypothetical protein|uniref:hypothetical protein n=1 Tax=Phenylobacterium sp. TaxID=1871053 RepID=UPI003918F83C
MNARKLGLLLFLGGAIILVLSIVWFFAAYAEAIDTFSGLGGREMAGKMMACLYSSPAICQGVGMFSEGPSYSPVVFWIGMVSLMVGVVVWISSAKPAAGEGERPPGADALLLGFIPSQKYARNVYLLMLIGAGGCLLLPPLAIVGLVGFVLALLGFFAFGTRLDALNRNHMTAACVVFAAASTLLLVTLGSILFLVVGLAQLALYYIGFNSYRHGRPIGLANLKDEALLALRPQGQGVSDPK